MKYIRTKDEIIDTETYLDKCFVKQQQGGTCKWKLFGAGCRACRYNGLINKVIIKQSETIEELCDEFVVVDERCGHRIALLSGIQPQGIKLYTYGAIWTDKGLIYVAKMNEKGELVLL